MRELALAVSACCWNRVTFPPSRVHTWTIFTSAGSPEPWRFQEQVPRPTTVSPPCDTEARLRDTCQGAGDCAVQGRSTRGVSEDRGSPGLAAGASTRTPTRPSTRCSTCAGSAWTRYAK